MRVLYGKEAALAALTRTPGYEEPQLPQEAAERTARIFGEPLTAAQAAARVVDDVCERGDAAVREWTRRIDGVEPGALEVPLEAWEAAAREIGAELRDALALAARRIRAFHEASMPSEWSDDEAGYGLRLAPLERAGLYVPGGSAAYPSTALMSAIPARVAGVREIIVCSPNPAPVTLAAALEAGVDRLFAIGGAQAVAAMAFGTKSVPRVDKICGPGNVFVALAKRRVYGRVDIDGLYGPTETMIVADETADAAAAAADLLAQAEHDALASPVLVATNARTMDAVLREVERQAPELERVAIARAALGGQGAAALVESVEEALEVANAFAPEHLCLLVAHADRHVAGVRNAGGVFVGETSPEALGDYTAGPSHVMPTGASARFASSLGVDAFLKRVPVVRLPPAVLREIGPAAAAIARAEGLGGHARAAAMRLEGGPR